MPDILTPAQVAECRERAERATDGPWVAANSNEGCWPAPPRWEVQSDTWANPHHYPDELLPEMCLQIEWYGGNTEADAEFIAHARTDIPALCATVEALRDVVEWQCRTKCAGYSSECTDRCRAAQVFRARELSR